MLWWRYEAAGKQLNVEMLRVTTSVQLLKLEKAADGLKTSADYVIGEKSVQSAFMLNCQRLLKLICLAIGLA